MHDESLIRVLHVISNMSREGAQTFIMNVYRNLDKSNVQFDFLVNTQEKCAYDDEIISMGGKIIYVPPPDKKNILNYTNKLSRIMVNNGPYKCVHSHSMYFNGIVTQAAYRADIPIRISHAHTISDGRSNSIYRSIYRNIMRKKILKYSTKLFGCSQEACKNLYGDKCFDDKRVKVINNGIELKRFEDKDLGKSSKLIKVELGLPLDSIIIGHVGRFHSQKNHVLLVDIFSELIKKEPKARLILVGDGPLKEYIKEKVKGKRLEKYIYFLGIREDIPKIMASLDVFIFPSKYEGLGIVLIEAQAAGIPCVVSNKIPNEADLGLGLIRKVDLNDDLSVWVNNIIESLELTIPDWEERKRIITSKKYSITSVAKILYDIYHNRS